MTFLLLATTGMNDDTNLSRIRRLAPQNPPRRYFEVARLRVNHHGGFPSELETARREMFCSRRSDDASYATVARIKDCVYVSKPHV